MIYIKATGIFNSLFWQYKDTEQVKALIFFVLGIIICMVIPYLLGSLNASIIVSKYLYHDDIRNYGSGNAGLTNMHRVFGKKGAVYTLVGDIIKQVLSVAIGMLTMGVEGAYLAGTFCILGHIMPVFYRFRGGKGVLTAATMVLLIDPVIFVILFIVFALVVLILRYISLGSMMAGFIYPALVYYRDVLIYNRPPAWTSMVFSIFIGLLIIFMHRENMKRIYNNEESRFSFKRKPLKDQQPEEKNENDKSNKK